MTTLSLKSLEARIDEMQSYIEAQTITIQELNSKIRLLEDKIDDLELKAAPRVSTPSSRSMNELDAYRVLYGDMKDMKTRDCADKLGLSMGQIYSARGGYTFKSVSETRVELREEMNKLLATVAELEANNAENTIPEGYIELPPTDEALALIEQAAEMHSTESEDDEDIDAIMQESLDFGAHKI